MLNNKGILVGSGRQTKGNLFYLELSECSCFIAQVEESWLWHKRLCHVSFDKLVKINKLKRVRGILKLRKPDMGIYKNCQLEKWERQVSKARIIILKKS